MTKSDPDRQNASVAPRPDRDDHAGDPDGDLPPEPNPEHPRLYHDEAHRWFKRLKSGKWDGSDLGAREWGLLAYWYPDLVAPSRGDPS